MVNGMSQYLEAYTFTNAPANACNLVSDRNRNQRVLFAYPKCDLKLHDRTALIDEYRMTRMRHALTTSVLRIPLNDNKYQSRVQGYSPDRRRKEDGNVPPIAIVNPIYLPLSCIT